MRPLSIGLLSLLVVLATGSSYSDLNNPIAFSEIFGNYDNFNNNNEEQQLLGNPCANNDNCGDDDSNTNTNGILDNSLIDEIKPGKYEDTSRVNDGQYNDFTGITLPKRRSSAVLANKRTDISYRDQGADLSAYTSLLTKYPATCACTTRYEPHDLGFTHFPRYLVKAVCSNRNVNSLYCWRGSRCKEIPYQVHVLTRRLDQEQNENDHSAPMLPDALNKAWKFKTITIAASCQCAA